MIDSSIDPDFAAFERQDSLKEARPAGGEAGASEGASRTVVYRGRLAALSPRSDHQEGTLRATTAVPDRDAPRPDPVGHLRAARLGFAAAVILVIYWLWIRRKRA